MTPSDSPLARRLSRERILLTGATGFLGSALLARLLRVTPGGEPVHVLLRSDARASARDRLERDVLSSSAFRASGLGPEAAERIQVVEGDLTREGLGMTAPARRELAGSITCIVHSAASCAFHQPLDTAVEVNALGSLRLLHLAAEAGSVPFVHISTAFVSGPGDGLAPEEVLPRGHTVRSLREGGPPGGPAVERARARVAEGVEARAGRGASEAERAGRAAGWRAAQEGGWRTPYTMSKALAEQVLVEEREDVPLTILRPSIIEAAVADPEPGWMDGLPGISTFLVELAEGRLPAFMGHERSLLDAVPVDRVVNAVLASVPAEEDVTVRHVTCGVEGRFGVQDLAGWLTPALRAHPPRTRPTPPPSAIAVRTPEELDRVVARRVRELRRRNGTTREVRLLYRLRALLRTYAPFLESNPAYPVDGLRALEAGMDPADRALFPLSTWDVGWEEQVALRWYPGILRILRREAPLPATLGS